MGTRAGVMPPWYIEKDISIQHYQFDPSLSDDEIAAIATWADNDAPTEFATDVDRLERSFLSFVEAATADRCGCHPRSSGRCPPLSGCAGATSIPIITRANSVVSSPGLTE